MAVVLGFGLATPLGLALTGDWAWDDGSPSDFEHSSESFDRALKSLDDDPSLACPPSCDADPAREEVSKTSTPGPPARRALHRFPRG